MSTTPSATGGPSPLEAVSLALKRTGELLFKRFDVIHWLTLAVCAFLAGLSDWPSSAMHFRNEVSGGDGGGTGGTLPIGGWEIPSLEKLVETLSTVLAVAWVAAFVLGVLLAIGVFFAWVSARGELMLLDGVVRGEPGVTGPWSRLRRSGNALFLARLWLVLAMFAVVAALAGSLVLALAGSGELSVMHAVMTAMVLLAAILVVVVLDALLTDFVAPALYLRNRGAIDALGTVWRDLLAAYPLAVLGFYGLRILAYLVASAVMILISCLTCCIAALPFVSAVVFLPIHVFFRAYSAYFFHQLGGPHTLFEAPAPDRG